MQDATPALTNAEQKVLIYAGSNAPTAAESVTPDTPLTELNLNWREKDLPESERTKHVHRLHPYLGKYIPQLVEIFLRKYFQPGQTVLDPFAGSGTTLVQANELGIASVGYDVSAFNILLMRAKTQPYDLAATRREVLDILSKVEQQAATTEQLPLWDDGDGATETSPVCESQYLADWYAPQALHELLSYRDLIANYATQDLLRVILSRAARSARLTTHFDLDFPKKPQREPYWCYKHSRTCKPTTTAIQFLRRYSMDALERIAAFATLRTAVSTTLIHGDVLESAILPADGVVTSPPYVGLIDYHAQHRYAYELLGLEDRSGSEIGRASAGAGQRAQRQYQESIANVFNRIQEKLPSGAPLIVVAGDRHGLYAEIARLCNVEVEAIIQRHVNRRTGRRAGEFYESIFVWRKR